MLKRTLPIAVAALAGLAIAVPSASAAQSGAATAPNPALCDALEQVDNGLITVEDLITARAPLAAGPPLVTTIRGLRTSVVDSAGDLLGAANCPD